MYDDMFVNYQKMRSDSKKCEKDIDEIKIRNKKLKSIIQRLTDGLEKLACFCGLKPSNTQTIESLKVSTYCYLIYFNEHYLHKKKLYYNILQL